MIYSYVGKRVEDGGWSGVCRFDKYLRMVFPELASITPEQLRNTPVRPGDLVITDNHLSLDIPDNVAVIAVHHGCAQTHWDRDEAWRTERAMGWCRAQKFMFTKPNISYVAPSRWVAEEFARYYGHEEWCPIIPNWVPVIPRARRPQRHRPVIIGDWRDSNKGSYMWRRVADLLPGYEFRPCEFKTDEERVEFYQDADLYLCLSRSEGGAYSVADAEAACLPIVTTRVGNYWEFPNREIDWRWALDNPGEIAEAIESVRLPRMGSSFYDRYTFDVWARNWREVASRALA